MQWGRDNVKIKAYLDVTLEAAVRSSPHTSPVIPFRVPPDNTTFLQHIIDPIRQRFLEDARADMDRFASETPGYLIFERQTDGGVKAVGVSEGAPSREEAQMAVDNA